MVLLVIFVQYAIKWLKIQCFCAMITISITIAMRIFENLLPRVKKMLKTIEIYPQTSQ